MMIADTFEAVHLYAPHSNKISIIICKKIEINVGLLRRLAKDIPCRLAKCCLNVVVFLTMVQLCEWTGPRSRCMERLQKLHNMGMRTLLQAYPRTPQSILDAKLHWSTLQQQSKLQRLMVVDMQMCPWGAPDYLKNLLTPKQSIIVTRGRFKLTLKAPKTCRILA